jgi:phosphate/sulfate permease
MIELAAVSWKLIAVVGGVIGYVLAMFVYWRIKKRRQD